MNRQESKPESAEVAFVREADTLHDTDHAAWRPIPWPFSASARDVQLMDRGEHWGDRHGDTCPRCGTACRPGGCTSRPGRGAFAGSGTGGPGGAPARVPARGD